MYKLYADDEMFQQWRDWVKDSSNSATVAYNEVDNKNRYSGYVMKWHCNTNWGTPTGSACCIRDP